MTCCGMPHDEQTNTLIALMDVLRVSAAGLMPTSAISPKLGELLLKLQFLGDMLSRFAFRGPDARLQHSRFGNGSVSFRRSHWL